MTRLGTILAGLVGGGLLLHTARVYRGQDPLAVGVVGLIALGLLLGLVELWLRAGRAHRVRRDARALPHPATDEVIDTAPASIRSALEALRSGRTPTAPGTGFTPFLVGLLVMLGMLGTFLGLAQTLAGARAVLTASPDVEALRAGLAGPFAGLTRAFGTSVAGVGASAALGLAAAWVRSAERRAWAAVAAYGSAVVHLTPAGRQAAAAEVLVEAAAAANTSVADGAAAAARAATEAAMAALATSFGEVRDALDAHAEQGGARFEALAERSDARFDSLATLKSDRFDTLTTQTTDRFESLAGRSADHLETLLSRVGEVADAAAERETRRVADSERALGTLERAGEAMAERLDAHARQTADRVAPLLERLDGLVDRLAETSTALEARDAALTERLGTHAAGLATHIQSTADTVREAADLLQAGGAELGGVAEMFADSVDAYRESNERWLASMADLQARLGDGADGAPDAIVGEYLDQTREVFGDALRFQRALFDELRNLKAS